MNRHEEILGRMKDELFTLSNEYKMEVKDLCTRLKDDADSNDSGNEMLMSQLTHL